MSSMTLNPPSNIEIQVKPGGRSKTVVKMMLANRWTTIYAAAFLPIIVNAVLVLVTFAWMKANNWTPEVFYYFFKVSLVMPAILTLVLTIGTYSFIAGNFKLVMGMGFTRRDIWWAVLKVAALNALIATLVISIFSAIEIVTQGYGINWYVLSWDLDAYDFYLHGYGYGPLAATVEFGRFSGHYFLILLTAQLAAALVATVRLRWGLLQTGAVALIIAITALIYSQSTFGPVAWDLGLPNLYYPYSEIHLADGSYSLELNRGPWPIEEIQKGIDDRIVYFYPVKSMAFQVATSFARILAFATVLFVAGAAVLKKTDMR